MSVITRTTIDHQEIRRWAEKFKAKPEIIDDPEAGMDAVGIRLDFPGPDDEVFLGDTPPIHEVSWQQFFQKFDEMQLAFIYEDAKELGDPSIAYRFIKRENVGQ